MDLLDGPLGGKGIGCMVVDLLDGPLGGKGIGCMVAFKELRSTVQCPSGEQ